MSVALVIVCAACVIVSCAILIYHEDFKTGVVGTIGLALIAFAAYSRLDILGDALRDGRDVVISSRAVIAWLGSAMFFGHIVFQVLYRERRRKWPWGGIRR